MKIVIDIPQIMYGAIKEHGITFLSRDDKKTLRKSIVNGTPLPEHLNKIKAEIEALPNANPSYTHTCDVVDREDVIDIIDKYIEGSESE